MRIQGEFKKTYWVKRASCLEEIIKKMKLLPAYRNFGFLSRKNLLIKESLQDQIEVYKVKMKTLDTDNKELGKRLNRRNKSLDSCQKAIKHLKKCCDEDSNKAIVLDESERKIIELESKVKTHEETIGDLRKQLGICSGSKSPDEAGIDYDVALFGKKFSDVKRELDGIIREMDSVGANCITLRPRLDTLAKKIKPYGYSELVSQKELRRFDTLAKLVIQFELSSFRLGPLERDSISSFCRTNRLDKNSVILLEGHADASGDFADNETLSKLRCRTVEKFLETQNVSTMTSEYWGEHGDQRMVIIYVLAPPERF